MGCLMLGSAGRFGQPDDESINFIFFPWSAGWTLETSGRWAPGEGEGARLVGRASTVRVKVCCQSAS